MIYELKPDEFSRVSHLFQGQKQYLPVHCVINGDFPGRIFVDNTDSPATALVWAITRWAYICGAPFNNTFHASFTRLLEDTIIPDTSQINMNTFRLYVPATDKWKKTAESLFGGHKVFEHREIFMTFNKNKYQAFRENYRFPAGVMTDSVILPLLPGNVIRNAPFISKEFASKTISGFRVIKDRKAHSICHSNGFHVGNAFMIAVETHTEEHRKGYATAATTTLLDYCLKHGYVPGWEVASDNIPSIKLAQKLGFEEYISYPVLDIQFQ